MLKPTNASRGQEGFCGLHTGVLRDTHAAEDLKLSVYRYNSHVLMSRFHKSVLPALVSHRAGSLHCCKAMRFYAGVVCLFFYRPEPLEAREKWPQQAGQIFDWETGTVFPLLFGKQVCLSRASAGRSGSHSRLASNMFPKSHPLRTSAARERSAGEVPHRS